MNDQGWYELTEGPVILQGDILRRTPITAPETPSQWPLPGAAQSVEVRVRYYDLVVMSQSCDLANEKAGEVLLAQLIPWPEVVRTELERGNSWIKSSKFRKSLVEGGVPNLSLLHKRENEPQLSWSVVDFRRLFVLPAPFVCQFAASLGPRLRLRSPYREHLAQAFARYFMRVGLPHDAKAFEKEGDIQGSGR